MRFLPVIDLKGGVVVRGIGGRRTEYRPVVSQLTASSQPLDVARAFRTQLDLTELYLADLDALAGAAPCLSLYRELHGLGCRLWVDAGVRTRDDAAVLADAGIDRIVVGLETVPAPEVLAETCRCFPGTRVVFSLDLRAGKSLGNAAWGTDSRSIAARAIAAGARSMIVLDLARVGVGEGTGTEELCGFLAREYPGLELVAGGGIRNMSDVERLQERGVQAALVASALHDGRISREDVRRLGKDDRVTR